MLEVAEKEYMELGTKSQRTGAKTLRVFDFDDTIAKTNSRVGITEYDKASKEQLKPKYFITPGAYAKFPMEVAANNPDIDYQFDYSQFSQVVDPKLVETTFKILRKIVGKIREDKGIPAVVLTARGHAANENIRSFLRSIGIVIPVQTLEGSNPQLKSEWIKRAMLDRDIAHVEFFDDSALNVMAVNKLKTDPELLDRFGSKLQIQSRLVKSDE